MSVISHLILQIPLLEDSKFKEVKRFFLERDIPVPTDMNIKDDSGNYMYAGQKVWCLNTYYGCYNYFPPIEDLIEFLRGIDWDNKSEVIVLYEHEFDEDSSLKMYKVFEYES